METKLTKRQAAIVGAATGILCGPFSDLHEFIEEIMGRPVWTYELGSEEVFNEIKEKAKPYLLEICSDGT